MGRMLRPFLLTFALLVTSLQADEDVLRPQGRPVPLSAPPPLGIVHSPWALGIELGGMLSFFGQNITQHQAPTYQSNLTNGSGIGPFLTIAIDYALTDALGIQAQLGYEQVHYSMSGFYDAPCETPPGSGFFIPTRIERSSSQTIAYWTGGFALRYRTESEWILQGGIAYHSRSNASVSTTDTITSGTCQFFDDVGTPIGQRRTTSGSNTNDFAAARLSLNVSVGYRVPLSENVVLIPRLGGQLFLNPLAGDNVTSGFHPVLGQIYTFTNRQLHALQLALSLWFNI